MPMSADFHALMMGPEDSDTSSDLLLDGHSSGPTSAAAAAGGPSSPPQPHAFSLSTSPYDSADILGQPIARREVTCFGISYLCSRARMRGAHQAMQLLRQRYDARIMGLLKDNARLRSALKDREARIASLERQRGGQQRTAAVAESTITEIGLVTIERSTMCYRV